MRTEFTKPMRVLAVVLGIAAIAVLATLLIYRGNEPVNAQANSTVQPNIVESGPININEGGQHNINIQLTAQPASAVTVNLTGAATNYLSVSKQTLTFQPSSWNVSQSVMVTASDNRIDDGSYYHKSITATLTYDGSTYSDSVTFNIDDNDARGIRLHPPAHVAAAKEFRVAEDGGTEWVDYSLYSQPTADVTMTVSSSDTTVMTVSPASCTITASAWATTKCRFTMTGVEDTTSTATRTANLVPVATGGDYVNYTQTSANVTLYVYDASSDPKPVLSDDGPITLDEGASESVNVKLSRQPAVNTTVSITAASDITDDVTVTPSTLTFTPVNWNTNQSVTIAAVADRVDEPNPVGNVTYTVTYKSRTNSKAVSVTVTDDDTRYLGFTPVDTEVNGAIQVEEDGGTATYNLSFGSRPSAAVTVTPVVSDTSVARVTPASITLQPSDWHPVNRSITFTINGISDDSQVASRTAQITHTVTGGDYNGIIVGGLSANGILVRVVNVPDAQKKKLVVTGPTSTPTEGSEFTYTVGLSKKPVSDVTVTITGTSGTSLASVDSKHLHSSQNVFTPENWSTSQTVRAYAPDDFRLISGVQAMLNHSVSSNDFGYNGQSEESMFQVSENDTANSRTAVVYVNADGLNRDCSAASYLGEIGNQDLKYSLSFGTRPTGSEPRALVCYRKSDGTYTPVQWDGNLNTRETLAYATEGNWYRVVLQADQVGFYRVTARSVDGDAPALSATVNANHSVNLALSNGPGNWWFRISSHTCTTVSGNSINGIQGYQPGTYSVRAYADSGCNAQIASASFTVPNTTLAITVNTNRSVDFALSEGPSNWWFRISSHTCTAVSGSSINNIRGYQPATYNVWVYADSGCSDQIASASFTIPDPVLAATVSTDRAVELTMTYWPGNWWFRISSHTCTAVSGSSINNIRGYQPATYDVRAYSDSGCSSQIAATSFTVVPIATAAASLQAGYFNATCSDFQTKNYSNFVNAEQGWNGYWPTGAIRMTLDKPGLTSTDRDNLKISVCQQGSSGAWSETETWKYFNNDYGFYAEPNVKYVVFLWGNSSAPSGQYTSTYTHTPASGWANKGDAVYLYINAPTTVVEGQTANVAFSLQKPLKFHTYAGYLALPESGDTATGSDLIPVASRVDFFPGETTKTFTVSTLDDSIKESDETFTVKHTSWPHLLLHSWSKKITIVDND